VIDLHLHLLPGVDDGASSLEESNAMLGTLSSMGFDRLILTPHLMEPLSDEFRHSVLAAMNTVAPLAEERGIGLALGYEHLLSPDLARRLRNGEPSTLAGSSGVLVELPFMHWPADTAHNLFTLREAGYKPVLAHPERYQDAVRNPQLLLDAIEHGAVPQITTGSLVGLYGADSQRLSRYVVAECLGRDLPFILSSDAHSNGRRLTSVADGLGWLRSTLELGELIVTWAADIVPTQLVSDLPLPSFRTWVAKAHPEIPVPAAETYLTFGATEQRSASGRGKLGRLFRNRGT
jgi:protein-tyrosine phosphatase